MGYLVAHWRGELSLAKSALLNGVLLYVTLIIVVVGLPDVTGIQALGFVGMAVFAAWYIWAMVGIVRCSIKAVSSGDSSKIRRTFGVLTLIGCAAVLVFTVKDLYMIVPR